MGPTAPRPERASVAVTPTIASARTLPIWAARPRAPKPAIGLAAGVAPSGPCNARGAFAVHFANPTTAPFPAAVRHAAAAHAAARPRTPPAVRDVQRGIPKVRQHALERRGARHGWHQ